MKNFFKENKFYIFTILIFFLLFQIKLPYYVSAPGGVIDISDRIEYDGKKETDGSLNMLYVTEYVATIPTYLLSYVIKDWDLEDMSVNQISDETAEEINTRNKIMLDNSINNAIYVAYTNAGHSIEVETQKNVVVGTTLKNGLEIGDEILEIEKEKIEDVEEIREKIEEKEVGDVLNIKIKRDSKELDVSSEIHSVDGKKVLGVVIVTNYEYKIDPEIELKFKSSESGSSGGLMMALSIYSAISDEDILKGRNIAGTGTIEKDGTVGEIAGIKYKIMGAVKNKMDVVLVPSENYEEAIEVVKNKNYDIEIVEAKTFQEAIDYLK